MLLTFDVTTQAEDMSLESLKKSKLPNVLEVGETNDVWVLVDRKLRQLVFKSKQTGFLVDRCSLDDTASCMTTYGISAAQISAAHQAMRLGMEN